MGFVFGSLGMARGRLFFRFADLAATGVEIVLDTLGSGGSENQYAALVAGQPVVPREGLVVLCWSAWNFQELPGQPGLKALCSSAGWYRFLAPTAPVPAWPPEGWNTLSARLSDAYYLGDNVAEPGTGARTFIMPWPDRNAIYNHVQALKVLTPGNAQHVLPWWLAHAVVFFAQGMPARARNFDYLGACRPSEQHLGLCSPAVLAALRESAQALTRVDLPDQTEGHTWPVERVVRLRPTTKGGPERFVSVGRTSVTTRLGTRPVKQPGGLSLPSPYE